MVGRLPTERRGREISSDCSETLTVKDTHKPTPVLDQPLTLQIPERTGHAGAPDPQHLRHRLMSHFEAVIVPAIGCCKEPGGQAIFDQSAAIGPGRP